MTSEDTVNKTADPVKWRNVIRFVLWWMFFIAWSGIVVQGIFGNLW